MGLVGVNRWQQLIGHEGAAPPPLHLGSSHFALGGGCACEVGVLLPHLLPEAVFGSRCFSLVFGVRWVSGLLFLAVVPAVKGSLVARAIALGGRTGSLSVGTTPRALASGRA